MISSFPLYTLLGLSKGVMTSEPRTRRWEGKSNAELRRLRLAEAHGEKEPEMAMASGAQAWELVI